MFNKVQALAFAAFMAAGAFAAMPATAQAAGVTAPGSSDTVKSVTTGGMYQEAQSRAEAIRGQADGEATRIYATAYAKDPEFFDFMRSMEAYKDILSQGATVVLSTKSKLFKHLSPKESAAPPTTRSATSPSKSGQGQ